MAGFKARKTVLLSKLETLTSGDYAYGSSMAPTVTSLDGSHAVQITDPSIDPIVGEYADLNHVRDWMGNSKRIQVSSHSDLSFKVPFSPITLPSGTIPAWGSLLRMCGFAQTIDEYYSQIVQLAADVSKATTTLTLVSVTGIKVGDEVVRDGSVAAAATVTAINTATKVVTISSALLAMLTKGNHIQFRRSSTVAATGAVTPIGSDHITLNGSPADVHRIQHGMKVSGVGIPANTFIEAFDSTRIRISNVTTAEIASGATLTFDYKRVYYSTVANAHEYGTMQVYLDRIMHKLTGVRGSVKIKGSAGELPMFEFNFKGLYNNPSDSNGTAQNPVYTAWKDPVPVNARNTYFSYFGISMNVKTFEIDVGNEVTYRNLINAEDVQIVDRKIGGTLSWECDALAAKNWFDVVRTGSTSGFSFSHGSEGGQVVSIHCDDVSLHDLKYEVNDGIYFFSASLAMVPNSGGDDLVISTY